MIAEPTRKCMAAMESLRSSPMPALGARDGVLLPRIRRILGLPTVARRRSIWSVVVLFSLVATLAIPSLIACRNTSAANASAATQPTTGPANEFANATPPTDEDLKVIDEPYRIGKNDLIQVSISDLQAPKSETVKQSRVGEYGTVSLPLIGQVIAQGETTKELETRVASQYQNAGFLKKGAMVSVEVIEAHGRTFSILGASNQPGQYAIPKNDFHLLDALSMSSGASAEAGETLYVLRDDPAVKREDKKRLIKVARTALMSGDASQNIVIRTDDLILVRPKESANSNTPTLATSQPAVALTWSDAAPPTPQAYDQKELEILKLQAEATGRIDAAKADLEIKRIELDRKAKSPDAYPQTEIEEAKAQIVQAEAQLEDCPGRATNFQDEIRADAGRAGRPGEGDERHKQRSNSKAQGATRSNQAGTSTNTESGWPTASAPSKYRNRPKDSSFS